MMPKNLLLPSNKRTASRMRYCKAWKKLYGPLEVLFDKNCTAANPGLTFSLNGTESTRLRTEDAIAIWELISKKMWKD